MALRLSPDHLSLRCGACHLEGECLTIGFRIQINTQRWINVGMDLHLRERVQGFGHTPKRGILLCIPFQNQLLHTGGRRFLGLGKYILNRFRRRTRGLEFTGRRRFAASAGMLSTFGTGYGWWLVANTGFACRIGDTILVWFQVHGGYRFPQA